MRAAEPGGDATLLPVAPTVDSYACHAKVQASRGGSGMATQQEQQKGAPLPPPPLPLHQSAEHTGSMPPVPEADPLSPGCRQARMTRHHHRRRGQGRTRAQGGHCVAAKKWAPELLRRDGAVLVVSPQSQAVEQLALRTHYGLRTRQSQAT
jgi:hypothetical protein